MSHPPKTMFQVGVCLSSIRKCPVNKTIEGQEMTLTTCPTGTHHREIREIGKYIKTAGDKTSNALIQLNAKFNQHQEISKIAPALWDNLATELFGLLILVAKKDALLKAHHLMQNPDSLATAAQGAKLAILAQDIQPPVSGYPDTITQYKTATLIHNTPYRDYVDEPYALAHAMELNATGLPILVWEITASSGAPNGKSIKATVPITPAPQTWTKHILHCESNKTTEQMINQMTQQGQHTSVLPAIRSINTMTLFIMEIHITQALPAAPHHRVNRTGNSPQNHTDLNGSLMEQSTLNTNQAPILTNGNIRERSRIELMKLANNRELETPSGSMETVQHLVTEFMHVLASPSSRNTILACPACHKLLPQIRRGSEAFDFMKHLRGHHKVAPTSHRKAHQVSTTTSTITQQGAHTSNSHTNTHTHSNLDFQNNTFIPGRSGDTISMGETRPGPQGASRRYLLSGPRERVARTPNGNQYARHDTNVRMGKQNPNENQNFKQSRIDRRNRPYPTATNIPGDQGHPQEDNYF